MPTYRGSCDSNRPRLLIALCLIAAGVLLFLANLGWLPIHHAWDYWPIVLVFFGLNRFANAQRPSAFVTGSMLVVLGIVLTLINTGIFRLRSTDGGLALAIIFLALGISSLAKVLDRTPLPVAEFDAATSGVAQRPADFSPRLDNFAFMGAVKRKLESQDFQGGTLTCLLGNIEIDLRRSQFPEGVRAISIDATAVMGGIKLRVPESWRVAWNGANLLGNFEDKTTPPHTVAAAPQLIVTGYVFMATIEVES